MQLSFFGGAQEVGRSGIMIEEEKSRVIMDYGVSLKATEPLYPLPVQGFVDGVIISHAHLDHSGAVPILYQHSEVPLYTTPPTFELMKLLIKDAMKITKQNGYKPHYSDAHFKRMIRNAQPMNYQKSKNITDNMTLEFNDAGHILGAATCNLKTKDHNVLYTGDFNLHETYLHKPAFSDFKDVDILITESTYGNREHPDRAQQEKEFVETCQKVVEEGGNVLVPAFAVGRSQEVIMMLRKHGISCPIYMDGMAKQATEIMLDFPQYLKDYDEFYKVMTSINWVNEHWERRKVFDEPSIIVSPAGMLQGGHIVNYILKMRDLTTPKALLLTGYQVEGTPGRRLAEEGILEVDKKEVYTNDVLVKKFDFSAHSGRDDLHKFVKKVNPKLVVCVHGEEEATQEFSSWIEDNTKAVAKTPKFGERINIDDVI